MDILEQNFSDWELIVVDDASSDLSSDVIEKFIKSDNRIRYFRNEKNMGPGPTRNVGMEKAKGEYILFWDADDRYEANLLEILDERIRKDYPDVLVYGLFEEYTKNKRVIYSYTHTRPDGYYFEDEKALHSEIAHLERETMLGYPWNKAYRLDILKTRDIRFPDIAHIEDILFNIDVMDNIKSLSVIEKPLYHYRNGGTSGVTARNLSNYFELQRRRIEAFIEQQERWDSCDDFVLETGAALYFRSLISSMERDYVNEIPEEEIIERVREESLTPLFVKLMGFVGDKPATKYLFTPLVDGQIEKSFSRVKRVSKVKNNLPWLFNILKQSR